MSRPKKTEATEETKIDEVVTQNEKTEATEETKIPDNVDKLMKLYSQYESFYVTPAGFVHPVDGPEYLLKGAVLYKNKYFKS